MELKSYTPTALAGEYVGGIKKPAVGDMMLTEEQARYELLNGTIVPKAEDQPQPQKKK